MTNSPNADGTEEPQISRRSVELFMGALATTLAEFKHVPLDDRDFQWIWNRLTLEIQSLPSGDPTLHSQHVGRSQFLLRYLDRLIRRWEQEYLDLQQP